MKKIIRLAAVFCGIAIATTAFAQDSTNRVFQQTDWSVFVEDEPTQCWLVSKPTETVVTEGGRVVTANRGEILMFVSYWPSASKSGEVSFAGGYPFKEGSIVKLVVGTTSFDLFTTGETAWAASAADDAKIVAAMKSGAQAVITGQSSRGKTTKDTFSLLGFTASVADAEKRCS